MNEWWSGRAFAAALILATALPLLWPPLPPLVDLPGHMGRYRVALDLGSSPNLAKYYDFEWALVGNLGVDLLVLPLGALLGLEPAVKLIVLAIPVTAVAGMLWLAREVHGRIPPTAAFALPLAYSYPFQFGFVNFCLGISMAFGAAALWVRLYRTDRKVLRAWLFVPIAFTIWISHSVAWGMLGLIIFGIELSHGRAGGGSWVGGVARAVRACLPLTAPLIPMAYWLAVLAGGNSGGWHLGAKIHYLTWIFKSGWEPVDVLSALALGVVLLLGLGRVGLRFDPRLSIAALLLFLAFAAMPGEMIGSKFADMRVAGYAVAVAVLAISASGSYKARQGIAIAACLFFAARIGLETWTYWSLSRDHQAQLRALDHVPQGARIFVLADLGCAAFSARRMGHLGSMGIVRRHAFVNGQWPMPGGRLLSVIYAPAEGFALDETQFHRPAECRGNKPGLEQVLAKLPRHAFDYVWLIDFDPRGVPRDPGLAPIWKGERGLLLRIVQ